MKVAIVGAGVSGLVAGRELHLAGHEVSLFEAGDHVGGHTNTVTVDDASGPLGVDTGFIVFNDRNYPNFQRLLDELAVATQPGADELRGLRRQRGFEWAARPFGLFARPAHAVDPRFHRMLLDLVRFNRDARGLIGRNSDGPSLRSFLADGGYSPYFVERFVVPQVSAIWSADPDQMWSFPASFLAEFFSNHGVLQMVGRPRWRSISGGAARYVEALTRPFAGRIHVRAPVRRIDRYADRVHLVLDDAIESFDEVVLATHSDQALSLLDHPTALEREVLGSIPYQPNETVVHTDPGLMPSRRAAWASWNYHLGGPPGAATVTYHMNRLQSFVAEADFFVTLNRTGAIDPERVIRKVEYAHPVYTPAGVAAQKRWREISGHRRTHFCGAYWRWGFHEDGVWSALRVGAALGASPPPSDGRATDALAPASGAGEAE